MLTFVHLSDLHFAAADAGSQFDLDLEIRERLLEDLCKQDLVNLSGVLVSGDIAFGGLKTEYEKANEWFEMIRGELKISHESFFFIPGNHDIDRKHLKDGSMLWDSHKMLRETMDANLRDKSLRAKLQDPVLDFLLPLKEYRDFAAKHGGLSVTAAEQLAWENELTAQLDDGTPVVIHGLNSAVVSDEADVRANLLVSPFQFRNLAKQRDVINLVMCHHPPSWLLDCNDVENRFHRHAHIVLTGHEHQSRCYQSGPGVRICAGAVHPTRGEKEWNPGYNIIKIGIETLDNRTLVTRVETRTWHKSEFTFVPLAQANGTNEFVHRQQLPLVAKPKPMEILSAQLPAQHHIHPEDVNQNAHNEDATFSAARRRLIVHFFQLGILDRLNCAIEAGVWEEEFDDLEGQAKWAKVFENAQKLQLFPTLWDSVASRNQNLANGPNPFSH